MEEGLFHNPVFVNHIKEFAVAAVGHREGHTEVDRVDPRTRKTEKVCPRYNTIPCKAHQDTYNQSGGKFEFRAVPTSFACDSSGQMVSKIQGASAQKIIDALNEAQKKIGKPPITGSMIAKYEAGLLKGDAKLRKGKFKDALKAYTKVVEGKKTPTFVKTRAEERVTALNAAVLEAIQEAQGLPPSKAKRALKKLEKQVKDMPEAKAALDEAMSSIGE